MRGFEADARAVLPRKFRRHEQFRVRSQSGNGVSRLERRAQLSEPEATDVVLNGEWMCAACDELLRERDAIFELFVDEHEMNPIRTVGLLAVRVGSEDAGRGGGRNERRSLQELTSFE